MFVDIVVVEMVADEKGVGGYSGIRGDILACGRDLSGCGKDFSKG